MQIHNGHLKHNAMNKNDAMIQIKNEKSKNR